jgi:hypothetical protein
MLPIPKEAGEAGRARHAAHLRRAHERHQLRRLHPACRAGILIGGPLAFVQTGDIISLDVAEPDDRLHAVEDEELARRYESLNVGAAEPRLRDRG